MKPMSVTEAISRDILRAYDTGIAIPPVRDRIDGVPAAYAVQRETVRVWVERGRRLAGQKIGLTAKAVQTQLGVDEPDYGALFADMILADGDSVAAGRVLQPRVEAEIAFVLKKDLVGEFLPPEAVVEATEYVTPAIEICGSRIAGWDIRIADTIADNASSGLIVLGRNRVRPALAALAAVPMTLSLDGVVAAEGRGDACLGNPAIAVAWLAGALTRFGGGLREGDVVMSGALAKMIAAEAGCRFLADFGGFGSVSVAFAAS
jgi:2-keto-4-pentenoate hydratase